MAVPTIAFLAARETDWLIQHFQPTYLFFIGVAGGIKDVELGNVVVATFARGYESIKVKDSVIYPRLHVEYSAHGLVEQATLVKVLGEKHPNTQTAKRNYEICLNQDSQD